MSLEEIISRRQIAALDKLIVEDNQVAQEHEAVCLLRSSARRSKNKAIDAFFCSPANKDPAAKIHATMALIDKNKADDVLFCFPATVDHREFLLVV